MNPKLAEGFFAYYGRVTADGVLTRREKALIGLALAHALKRPCCIDATTGSLHARGVTEVETSEAVHVAAAMAAGIALVHGVQMMGQLDRLNAPEG